MRLNWNATVKELSNLFFFWFYGVTYFFVYRITFIALFRQEMSSGVSLSDLGNTLFTGFRFDGTVVAYFMLLPLLALLIFSYTSKFKLITLIRKICQILFVVFSSLLCLITLNYYSEYHNQFNNFLFMGLFDDDKVAIAKTIWLYFHPILNLIVLTVSILIGLFIFKYYEKGQKIAQFIHKIDTFKGSKLLIIILALFLFVSCIRGTFKGRPIMRKWAAVTSDPFLNKTIVNPFRSLKYAYEDYLEFSYMGNTNPYDKKLKELSMISTRTISKLTHKRAKGARIERPKQIFLVLMESYDSWPLIDKYKDLGLSTQLNHIAEQGMHFDHFLPAYNATFYAYGTITSGIPYCGLNINQLANLHGTYITSIFKQFEKLGYITQFFYGGFLSWQNVGDYSHTMGCDRIFSAIDAGGKSESGDWGIEDEKLFDLVLANIDSDEYTFNLILTSSYHAPYSIDVVSKGFQYTSVTDLPASFDKVYDGAMSLSELGHLWYGDWAIGKFVKAAEKSYEAPLFAFTGDHYG